VTTPSIPQRWTLIARDAFNGLLLWELPMADWGTDQWKRTALRSTPATLSRRLVAGDDRVFVTLGYNAPVSALDAASGKTLVTYEATEGAEEIRLLDRMLLFRKGAKSVAAVDVDSGKQLWEAAGNIRPLSLAAQRDKVFYQDGPSLVCLNLAGGEQRWRVPAKQPVSLLLACDDLVITSTKQSLQALSAETGATVWSLDVRLPRDELFLANDRLWHWEGGRIVGRDPGTGNLTTRLDTDDVFTPGHHLRCYQSKATEQFLITPNRGVEFVSLTGGLNTQADWVRGPCRFGIMPANGLLYAGPDPCFCYPGVKLTGFTALAPQSDEGRQTGDEGQGADRLKRGPAYGSVSAPHSALASPHSEDWPTYRHDARRTGATTCEVGPRVSPKWQISLPGQLTPPVVAGDSVYVASKDLHTVYAMHLDDGRRLWRFAAAGPIDSPPTVYGDRVLFGCADGRVYCLRAADGELVWRFQAAPSDERIIAFNRLESPWRVHGSVLVEDGIVYCTAGRSTYLDGGIRVFALEADTGKVLHETCLNTWARTREDARGKPFVPGYQMEGAQSDILASQGGAIYLGQVKFDAKLVEQEVPYVVPGPNDRTVGMDLADRPFVAADEDPKSDYETHQRKWIENTQTDLVRELRETYGGYTLGQRRMGLHVLATGGFLDDSWFNRTYWTYSTSWPGYYLAHRASKTGQLLVVGPQKTYAVQAFPSRNLQSPLFTPGDKGYLLFADQNDNEPVLDDRTRETTKGWGFTRSKPPEWHDWVPVRIRGMVLAGEHLFVAGPPDVVDADDPMAAFEGRRGALLVAHTAVDGKKLFQLQLDAPPVFDGLIAARGRLLLSTTGGKVVCLGQ
jgi:outer membrane protein assembly factor BamB